MNAWQISSADITTLVGRGVGMIVLVMALLFGSIIGSALKLQDRVEGLAGWITDRLGQGGETRQHFVNAIVTPSLLFCIGPLTIVGSLTDGLGRGSDQLIVKSILDGFAAIAFASSLGIGVLFSAGMVAIIQGTLTLAGFLLGDVLPTAYVDIITATGGVILLALALSLLDVKKIRVAESAACPRARAPAAAGRLAGGLMAKKPAGTPASTSSRRPGSRSRSTSTTTRPRTTFGDDGRGVSVLAERVFKHCWRASSAVPSPSSSGVVPVSGQLDLQGLRCRGRRQARADMADPASRRDPAGYVVGGISPLGQRTRLRTVVDASALAYETVLVSGGRRGLTLELAPTDLVRLTDAVVAPIGRS